MFSTNRLPVSTRLFQLLTAGPASRAIRAAGALGLADLLAAGPLAPDALAERASVHAPSLRRLMRALMAAGLFRLDTEGRYALNPLSAALRADAPGSLLPLALAPPPASEGEYWGDLAESVRTGRPSFEARQGERIFDYLGHASEEALAFSAGMTQSSLAQAPYILESYDFSPFRRMVDIGGGQGALLAALLAACPEAHGTLLDLPYVVADTAPLCEAAAQSRCRVVGGDFWQDPIPEGDLYLLKAILHDWPDEAAQRLLSRIRQVLRPGARLLVIEMVVPRQPVEHPALFMDLHLMALTDGGRERTRAEFEALFAGAGLRLRRVLPTGCPLRILECSRPRNIST